MEPKKGFVMPAPHLGGRRLSLRTFASPTIDASIETYSLTASIDGFRRSFTMKPPEIVDAVEA